MADWLFYNSIMTRISNSRWLEYFSLDSIQYSKIVVFYDRIFKFEHDNGKFNWTILFFSHPINTNMKHFVNMKLDANNYLVIKGINIGVISSHEKVFNHMRSYIDMKS